MGDLYILVVSGDANFRDYLCNYLLMDGHYVDTANHSDIARKKLQGICFDLILLSVSNLDNKADILTVEEVQEINPNSELVFLFNPNCEIGQDSENKKGVKNCLLKPYILEDLPAVLQKALQRKSKRMDTKCPLFFKREGSKDRRKHFRIPVDIPIKYTFFSPLGNLPSQENVSKLVNMSEKGVMFRADLKTKLSEFVYLHILLPTITSPINIEGEIRWERFNSMEPWRYVGVSLANMNEINNEQIISFISSNQRRIIQ